MHNFCRFSYKDPNHILNITVTISEHNNPNSCANLRWAAFKVLSTADEPGLLPYNDPIHVGQPITGHHLQDQLSMFIPHVSWWRTFKYNCEALDDLFVGRALLANLSAPILESFSLELSPRMSGQDGNALEIFEGGAPRLSHINIGGIHPFMCLPPLSSVTTLRFAAGPDEMSGDEFLDILRSCVTLISLDIGGRVVRPNDLRLGSMMGENVEIATLRSLSFSAYASLRYFIASMLTTIHCPAVELMSISALSTWESPEESPSTHAAAPLPHFL
jgi:hypothetical protein